MKNIRPRENKMKADFLLSKIGLGEVYRFTANRSRGIHQPSSFNFKGVGMKVTILTLLLSFCLVTAHAFTDEQIVNAIFKAEGGYKATYLYGIVSVPYENEAEARQICFNTVRNNRVRFANQTKYTDYLEFLASRYCPIGADNDPRGLNKNWLGNVRYFLNNGGAE